jgi:hypothetical protein
MSEREAVSGREVRKSRTGTVSAHSLCRMLRQIRASGSQLRQRLTLSPLVPLLWLMAINLTGCTVVKGIFKAGVWVGVLGVFAVVALVVYGISKLGRRS